MPHHTPAAIADRFMVLKTAEELVSLLKLMQRTLTLHIENRRRASQHTVVGDDIPTGRGCQPAPLATAARLAITSFAHSASPIWLQRGFSTQDNFAGDL